MKEIKAAFRHELIHLWQLKQGRTISHTKEFYRIAASLTYVIDPKTLNRPPAKHKTFYYICPSGCQQFSSVDNPEVNCFHCGRKMQRYNSEQYKKIKKVQRQNQQKFRQGRK